MELVEDAGHEATIIWADGPGPRPAKPYITLKIISAPRVGQDETLMSSDLPYGADEVVVVVTRQGVLSINVIGGDSLSILNDIDSRVFGPKSLDSLHARAISCLQTTGPRDMTGFLDTAPESRSQMDVIIGWADAIGTGVGPIEHVEAEGTLKGSDHDHDIDVEIGETE